MTKEEGMEILVEDLKAHVPNDILKVVYENGVELYDYQIDALTSVRFSNSALAVSKSPKFISYLMKGNFLAMVIHKLKGIVFMMILC